MSIDIRAIKIILDTNIPGKNPVPFTKSMLYNPVLLNTGSFNEYPYFTMDILFPEVFLYRLPYQKQVSFFFDKSYMANILQKYAAPVAVQKQQLEFSGGDTTNMDEREKKIEQAERTNKNIMIMLKILFPIKYPIMHNVTSSFSSVILKKNEFNLKWNDFIPPFLKNKLFEGISAYSYLKIDGKVYTVTQLVWLNDIYNHIEYGELVDKFDKLNKWKVKAIAKLKDEISRKHNKFNTTYNRYLQEITIEELQDLKQMNKFDKSTLTREMINLYTEFDDLIDKLIQSIESLKTDLSKISTEDLNEIISTTSKQLATYYNSLNESKFRTYFQPKKKNLLDKFVTNLNRDIEEILVLEYILEMYLNRPGLNLDFEKDEPKYKDKLKEKFKIYTDFADNIKKFRAPQRESTNLYLQDTFDDFLDNSEPIKGMFNFIMNPYNLGKNPIKEELKKPLYKNSSDKKEKLKREQPNFFKRMDTGVTILSSAAENEPYFEIYVQTNLIGGELNDEKRSLVDCMYKGESSGDRLEYLLNQSLYYPWSLNNSRIFFDITEGPAKDIIVSSNEKPNINKTEPNEEKKIEQIKQGGSNSTTRKIREQYLRSTRKRF